MQNCPSYWEQDTYFAPFDVLIVGGGIVGCAAALHCAAHHPRLRIGLVERATIPYGASTRNAGFASFGSISEVENDIAAMGEERAITLMARRKNGLQRLLETIAPARMDYEHTGGYEIFLPKDEDRYHRCMGLAQRLNARLGSVFGGPLFVADDEAGKRMGLSGVTHTIAHPFEGILHPGKMMQAFWEEVHAAGVQVLSGFAVRHLETSDTEVRLMSPDGITLQAKYVVTATNAFARELIERLDVQPARNQVYLTTPVVSLKLRGAFHYDQGYVYFRNVGQRVLIGGARNTDFERENTQEFGLTEHIREQLSAFVGQHILQSMEFGFDHAWSGIIALGPEKSPIVAMHGERIAVAVRLGGMGVAIGSLVGVEAAQMVLDRL